jgi:hypothetical protein
MVSEERAVNHVSISHLRLVPMTTIYFDFTSSEDKRSTARACDMSSMEVPIIN